MKDHSEQSPARPYAALLCILMLLGVGFAIKIGAALHVCQLGPNSCGLPLW
jgi:hypothetical protein